MEKWESRNEYVKTLTPVKSLDEIKKSGIQMTHLLNTVYVDNSEAHSLVIGDTGSGKTQMITLPLIKTSIKAGDSIIINDDRISVIRGITEANK